MINKSNKYTKESEIMCSARNIKPLVDMNSCESSDLLRCIKRKCTVYKYCKFENAICILDTYNVIILKLTKNFEIKYTKYDFYDVEFHYVTPKDAVERAEEFFRKLEKYPISKSIDDIWNEWMDIMSTHFQKISYEDFLENLEKFDTFYKCQQDVDYFKKGSIIIPNYEDNKIIQFSFNSKDIDIIKWDCSCKEELDSFLKETLECVKISKEEAVEIYHKRKNKAEGIDVWKDAHCIFKIDDYNNPPLDWINCDYLFIKMPKYFPIWREDPEIEVQCVDIENNTITGYIQFGTEFYKHIKKCSNIQSDLEKLKKDSDYKYTKRSNIDRDRIVSLCAQFYMWWKSMGQMNVALVSTVKQDG